MAVLAIDQGTTSSRAVLFDVNGVQIACESLPIKQYYPAPGWVEHDPMEILASVYKCAERVLCTQNDKVLCIGITNQRETIIAWDKRSGKPVCPAIVWQCRRTAPICEQLMKSGAQERVNAITGLNIDAYFSGTKIKWILENVKGARELANNGHLLVGTVESWLVWNMTGNHFTDVTNASRTMLLDINTLEWSEQMCELLDIPMGVLPKVVDNAYDFGCVKCDEDIPECLWNIPIRATVGDQQGALFGQQCFNVGDVKNTYGTGCFTLMNVGDKVKYANKLLSTVAFKISDKLNYAIEGSVFNGGSSIQWLRDELQIISSARECDTLAEKVKDSEGVLFVPAFTGLGAPYWDMYARGSFFGLTRGSKREHICRAVLDGIAYQVADLVSTMERETGCKISSLKVDGGASVSDIMMQFQADILMCAVDRPSYIESTALGAAYMAGIGQGIWSFEDISKKRICDKLFIPKMSQKEVDSRMARWRAAIECTSAFAENGQ